MITRESPPWSVNVATRGAHRGSRHWPSG
jgi:hypothetical protein